VTEAVIVVAGEGRVTDIERRFIRQLDGNLTYARKIRGGWVPGGGWKVMAAMIDATATILTELEWEAA
jgi:hypothetical protein